MGRKKVETGEIEDRPLTSEEQSALAADTVPATLRGGNGERLSFAALPPETVREYQRRAVESRRHNTATKKLGQQLAYLEAHKEHAATILGGRLAIIEGLLGEMIDPATKQVDTRRLDEKRLKVLQTALNDFDKGMGMQPKADTKAQTLDVNVTHTVSQIIDRLGK